MTIGLGLDWFTGSRKVVIHGTMARLITVLLALTGSIKGRGHVTTVKFDVLKSQEMVGISLNVANKTDTTSVRDPKVG